MQKKSIDTGQAVMESTMVIGNCALIIESQPGRNLSVTQKRLEKFSNIVKVDFPEKSGYRRIGKHYSELYNFIESNPISLLIIDYELQDKTVQSNAFLL